MNVAEQIRRKRDGEALPADVIRKLVSGITTGDIPDYQASALLMAIYFRGLSPEELSTLTDAMLHSGEVLSLPEIKAAKIDKHSTGGVGDKISICLAPAVAACGVAVPMISGRGLGHTGGTLDKLEAIPGFRVQLDGDEFRKVLGTCGMVMGGQTPRIAPADRKLYALRDVTGTVESIPLIASSIMSKKLAEGIDGLVLDVKVGRGAFMKTLEQARALAETLVGIGRRAGKRTTAVLSRMDQPLGRAIGNGVEVEEAIAVMRADGPPDVTELTLVLGAEMLLLGGVASSFDDGRARIAKVLTNGSALAVFRRCVELQGGDPHVIDEPNRLYSTTVAHAVRAPRAGVISDIDAEALAYAALNAGAGRLRKEDPVDPAVGILLAKKVGDEVAQNEPVAVLLHRMRRQDCIEAIARAFTVADSVPDAPSIVIDTLRG